MYVAIGLTFNDERDIFGIWAGDGGEDAKFWLSVLTEIETRGVGDICIVVCDGLKRLPEAINPVWELAVVQTRIIHLIRNTSRRETTRRQSSCAFWTATLKSSGESAGPSA